MDPESRDYTSFKTHRQPQYRFKVVSFGRKNAAATFQREINKALHEYKDFARAYIDDIAIFSKNWKSHMVHLDMILTKLEELRFTVNISKCDFAKPQIKYLGHVIGSGKHQADREKIEAISRLSKPKTKKTLRSLLGLCNYYRDYIPKYSELVYPLTEHTKKKIPEEIPWKEEHDIAFEELKNAPIKAPSLYTPVLGQPFIIHCDASQIGVAACLSQNFNERNYPIAYASQKLTRAQQSWSTIEREAYAIV
ncbi:uncharacterized mitochondrial protein AtMg00860-like [Stegodyphus dumicola]|uniref:uncharacterized mitochondrial protein AtMg00860-like n=1 Tax=Stegodyphus dumicola TaxID=202533 RepID=UPI0015AF4131|nr:uncharacterized mitochondrial protein AtMg00860-like [Stegodyphus dumicola]